MSPRMNWFGLCVVSALVGALVASHPAGKDRAIAQVRPTAMDIAASDTVVNACTRCSWSYSCLSLNQELVQVLPPGTTGVLHGVRVGGVFLDLFDGPTASDPRIGTIYTGSSTNGTQSVDFDVRFTNGFSVHSTGNGAVITVLYKLDTTSPGNVEPD